MLFYFNLFYYDMCGCVGRADHEAISRAATNIYLKKNSTQKCCSILFYIIFLLYYYYYYVDKKKRRRRCGQSRETRNHFWCIFIGQAHWMQRLLPDSNHLAQIFMS